jgi:putative ABC transport system permease protein
MTGLNNSLNLIYMFKTILRITWRNITRDPRFTVLNLFGLSTGLACTLLIYLWVNDELQVDRFNEKDKQLFQILMNIETPNGIETGEQTPGLLADALAKELPEVEYAASVIPVSWSDKKGILIYQGNQITASNQFVGRDYFKIFTYHFLAGDMNQDLSDKSSLPVLADKSSIVISRGLAMKMFKTTENVVGKTIEWNQKDYGGLYRISGIFENPPANATIQFDIAFNYELFLDKNPNLQKWTNNDPVTYLTIKPGTDINQFNFKIADFIKTKNDKSKTSLFAQKFSERYLNSHYENGLPNGGRIDYVNLFSVTAIFILIIACINFMNLSTAKAIRRIRDAGVKKILGARRSTLITQFLCESLVLTFLSTIIAIVFVFLLLPRFNLVTGKQLSIPFKPEFLLIIICISIITGLISGSYPAIYLAGFKPAFALKGKTENSIIEIIVRKGLVIFQFTLSVIFIVSVLVVYKQMNLIQTRNLGYDRNNIIYFDKGGMVSSDKEDYLPGGKFETSLQTLMLRVKNVPGVMKVTNFRHNITNRNGGTYDLSWQGKDPNTRIDFTDLAVGYGFIETTGIKLKEGRSFSGPYVSEKSKIIFNQAAIDIMGIREPIGKTVSIWGEARQIIGVMENFNFQSLHENLKPCFLDLTVNQRASKIMVKLKPGQEKETIARLDALYREENKGLPFEYRFLDEDYQALYASEKKVAKLSTYFAALAIIISCLGLFGLAAFTAERRQKEIGIRKVIGASANNLVMLLSKDFLKLIAMSILIAFPISWWAMYQWLQGFAYRVDLGIEIFVIAGFSTLVITIFSISFQSVKAAFANPVKSLRADY